jgi:hypothetical protein
VIIEEIVDLADRKAGSGIVQNIAKFISNRLTTWNYLEENINHMEDIDGV